MSYFHVRIVLAGPDKLSGDEVVRDLSQEQLETRFLRPRRDGRPITVRGRTYEWDAIERVSINETDQPSDELLLAICARRGDEKTASAVPDEWYVTQEGREVTDALISEPVGSNALAPPSGPDVLHVQVSKGLLSTAEAFNLSAGEVNDRFVEPWADGRQVTVGGKAWLPSETRISIYEAPELSRQERSLGMGWLKVVEFGEDVTDRYIADVPAPAASSQSEVEEAEVPDPRTVAVAYGRDTAVRDAMFEFLRALDLRPLEWEELVAATGSAMPYSGEAVQHGFTQAQAVVVLFSPDDEARLHPDLWRGADEADHEQQLTAQPRSNVLLEAGLALATHSDRTVIVEFGALRPISNLSGRNVVRIDGTVDPLNALAGRLERAGCEVKRDRGDWLDAARFGKLSALTRRAGPTSSSEVSGVRLEDSPNQGPVELRLVSSGRELWDLAIADRAAMSSDAPDTRDESEAELLAAFLDNIFDWGEVTVEAGPGGAVRAARELGDQLEELRASGFVVYAGRRERVLTGGVGAAQAWSEAVVKIFRLDDPRIRDQSEEAERAGEDAQS